MSATFNKRFNSHRKVRVNWEYGLARKAAATAYPTASRQSMNINEPESDLSHVTEHRKSMQFHPF
jgi:hypothetical protein